MAVYPRDGGDRPPFRRHIPTHTHSHTHTLFYRLYGSRKRRASSVVGASFVSVDHGPSATDPVWIWFEVVPPPCCRVLVLLPSSGYFSTFRIYSWVQRRRTPQERLPLSLLCSPPLSSPLPSPPLPASPFFSLRLSIQSRARAAAKPGLPGCWSAKVPGPQPSVVHKNRNTFALRASKALSFMIWIARIGGLLGLAAPTLAATVQVDLQPCILAPSTPVSPERKGGCVTFRLWGFRGVPCWLRGVQWRPRDKGTALPHAELCQTEALRESLLF